MYIDIWRKSGFSLIEVIMTISIMSILFSFTIMGFKSFSNFQNDIEVERFENKILSFIVSSKLYCRNENTTGYIYFDFVNQRIVFNMGTKYISQLKFPENFDLKPNLPKGRMDINNNGEVQDACSIYFKDRKKEMHCITVCVGTFYVDIKY